MAGNSNTVTLTFAGDSSRLDKTFKDVGKNADDLTHNLKDVGAQAKATKTLMRGAGDAAQIFGGELGQSAVTAGYALSAVKDLSKGLAGLTPKLKESVGGLTLLRGAGLTAGVALAAFGLQQEAQSAGSSSFAKKAIADMNLALATNVHFVTQGVPLLGRLTDAWRNSADGVSQSAHSMVDSAQRASDAILAAAKAAALFQAPDTNPGGDAIFTALDAQNIATQSYADQSGETWATYAASVSKGGGSVAHASSAAADKVKATQSKWQSIADGWSDIAKGIAESFGPKLEAALANTSLLHPSSGGIVAGLRKQLDDTKKLNRDIKALAKAGLDPGLLKSLVAGGLDSLPAAEELLAGGAGGISTVNGLVAGINKSGGQIAGGETAREIANQQKPVKVEVNIKGTQGDFEKLLRKMFKTQGPESFGLKAA